MLHVVLTAVSSGTASRPETASATLSVLEDSIVIELISSREDRGAAEPRTSSVVVPHGWVGAAAGQMQGDLSPQVTGTGPQPDGLIGPVTFGAPVATS